MSASQPKPRGLYFEEFQPAQKIVTAGRTVTEADVVNFAGLSGDYNQMHVDEAYSQKNGFWQARCARSAGPFDRFWSGCPDRCDGRHGDGFP